jgi:hypothetical protein
VGVDVPCRDILKGASDVVGDLNTQRVVPGIGSGFEGDGSADAGALDNADSSKARDNGSDNVGRLSVTYTLVKSVLGVARRATASKGSGASVGAGTDGIRSASVGSVSARIDGGTSVTVSRVARSALAARTERGVSDAQGLSVARSVCVALLVRTFGGGKTAALNANNQTFGRRSSVISGGVSNATSREISTGHLLVPPQVGVTTPTLEVETSHSMTSLAHTTKAREV